MLQLDEQAQTIASKTINCSFNISSIKQFIVQMAIQQKEYSDFRYQGNGSFTLILKVKKNGVSDVALKVIECKDHEKEIEGMKKVFANQKYLSKSEYFVRIFSQFFLAEIDENVEQSQIGKLINLQRNSYFVQEMDLHQGNLRDVIQKVQLATSTLNDSFKEILAIQILDAINSLHQKQIAHGNIKVQNFLVQSKHGQPLILKLRNIGLNSTTNLSQPPSDNNNIEKDPIEQDLYSLGIVLLQLDNMDTFDGFKLSNYEEQFLENHDLNRSSYLYKISCIFLSKLSQNNQSVCSVLQQLHKKSLEHAKIPLYSVILKTSIDQICQEISFKKDNDQLKILRQSQDLNQPSKHTQSPEYSQQNPQLTADLLKSALHIMLEWEEFQGTFNILKISTDSAVFGVYNFKQKRKSVLRVSLCTSQAETLQEIGIMNTCQGPHFVKFYGHKFFEVTNHNLFIVYELERCQYSLVQYLEESRYKSQNSEEFKHFLMHQILDSVSFTHWNRILHRNITLGSFFISEEVQGQPIAKLGNFYHAARLQESFMSSQLLDSQIFRKEYFSPFNCIIRQFRNESLLYFSPERWERSNPATYYSDSYSVGICLILLDNFLMLSEEDLIAQLGLNTQHILKFCSDKGIQINQNSSIFKIAKEFLTFLPSQRKFVTGWYKKCIESGIFRSKLPIFQQENYQKQQDTEFEQSDYHGITFLKLLPAFSSARNDLSKLANLSLDLSRKKIGVIKADSLLLPLAKCTNLSDLSLNLSFNSLGSLEAEKILLPLKNLINLSSLTINLDNNSIRDIGAQILLCPLFNLINLSALSLNLAFNGIGPAGAQTLFSLISELKNLSSISLDLTRNPTGDINAQSLLCPLSKLLRLSSLSLNLCSNLIRPTGAQSLLSPLSNLFMLQALSLYLGGNSIGDIGAQSLLSPLSNLTNLSNISIDLISNQIGSAGAQSLLCPLSNLFNLSSFSLCLSNNQIDDIGAKSLLSPLTNLMNLSSLTLILNNNQIGETGGQTLLSPLVNLVNLQSFSLSLNNNNIRANDAQILLCPLSNMINMQNLELEIFNNFIEDKGATSLLIPISNLLNLYRICINLGRNQISHIGAESLLSPLAKLINLSSIFFILDDNKISDVGAQHLLSPLTNLLNISTIFLSLKFNSIGVTGAQYLLYPLKNYINLQNIILYLNRNQIGDIGSQFLLSPLSNLMNLSELSLDLSWNLIEKKGSQYLLSPLTNLTNLSSLFLNLDSNSISDMGVYNIFSLLSNFDNLSNLSLQFYDSSIDKQTDHLFKYFLRSQKNQNFS